MIRLAFGGAEAVELDGAGALILRTAVGELRQAPPILYQEIEGTRRVVDGGYILLAPAHGAGVPKVAFRAGAYDASRPLVIDPVLSM